MDRGGARGGQLVVGPPAAGEEEEAEEDIRHLGGEGGGGEEGGARGEEGDDVSGKRLRVQVEGYGQRDQAGLLLLQHQDDGDPRG